ncbi:MAG: DUF1330 domain-containing protein [Myxococcales bacterium]|nr:DUF1330 domain-containing protein [Myxococcales bacterium]
MSGAPDRLAQIDRQGRIALLDLVKSPTHEARLALPSLMKRVLERSGGRLAWAGSVDQQLIGTGSEDFDDILISEFPNREACVLALAERAAWDPEIFVSDIRSIVAVPWSTPMRWIGRAAFGLRALRGGGPPPYDPAIEDRPTFEQLEMGAPEFGPTREQLEALQGADLESRVVMVNFLEFREQARHAEPIEAGTGVSGRAAYGRYSANTIKIVGHLGGRIRWAGARARLISEGPEQSWTQVALMQYPSRAHFIGMLRDGAYQAGTPHRDAGLERTELIACTSHAAFY